MRLSDLLAYVRNWNADEHKFTKHKNLNKAFNNEEHKRLEWFIGQISNGDYAIELKSNRRYTYCIASSLEFADEMLEELECVKLRNLYAPLITKLEYAVKSAIVWLCDEMEKHGYEYLYDVSDEEISEVCESNDWWFYETGKFAA